MLVHQSLSSTGAPPYPRLLRRRDSLLSRRRSQKSPSSSPSTSSPCFCLHIGTETVSEIAQNKVIIGAAVSAVIGQISKPFTSVFLYGNKFELNSRWISRAGGFPSAHSSAVIATATSLGLERGFSDSIFGLAVVYAGIVMYDAQGVRREVGNQAKLLNNILLKEQANTSSSNCAINFSESSSEKQSSSSLERPDPQFLQEPSSAKPMNNNTSLLRRLDNQTTSTTIPSKLTVDVRQGSGDSVHESAPLKEWVGHTEVEVVGGAILGFLVSLIIHTI